jgi:hypothetical protein
VAGNCQHQVPHTLLMCNDHWRQVPEKLRREIWLQHRRRNHHPEALELYRKAVQAAIDAVYAKQLKKKDGRDAATKPLF